ncbi:hypothetical protein BUALT_Bualt14G0053200 [Buddleja alternifolia]|uniref:Uncharacterized protein n=1 Tax=Buddleja alternifolia TaxID=168488 RepID=A0AAV6WNG1_9LAMI|nr:hypothetical protein BUALT_Bualt14G0053200 [Buddleja alternifolia]
MQLSKLHKQMRRAVEKKKANDNQLELTPLVDKPVLRRRIRRCVETKEKDERELTLTSRDERIMDEVITKLEDSLPRFGPLYIVEQDSIDATKDKAWQHLLKNSASSELDQSITMEIYSSAIRKVEQEAKEAYAEKVSGIGSQFLWMMIKDGCFFLQLALLILGSSPEHLGYPSNDPIFGKKHNKKDVKKWIEAMLFPGNQIPLVVLHKLMNQQFFQNILAKRKWEPPQFDLCKMVLYDFLVFPARKGSNQGLCRKERIVNSDQPSDLLHGLQKLVLGPGPPGHLSNEYEAADDDIDLEANEEEEIGRVFPTTIEDNGEGGDTGDRLRVILNAIGMNTSNSTIDDRKRIFPCATELKRAGIRIRKLKNGGARSIHFKSYYLLAFLYLPAFPVDDNTEILFRILKSYEISQQFGKHRREISSYLRVMSDIIQTPRDVKLLEKNGIIVGNSDDAEKLPGILNRLSSSCDKIRLTHEFRVLRSQIRDYSSPLIHYKGVINLVVFLTLLQTFFALLAYFKPPK